VRTRPRLQEPRHDTAPHPPIGWLSVHTFLYERASVLALLEHECTYAHTHQPRARVARLAPENVLFKFTPRPSPKQMTTTESDARRTVVQHYWRKSSPSQLCMSRSKQNAAPRHDESPLTSKEGMEASSELNQESSSNPKRANVLAGGASGAPMILDARANETAVFPSARVTRLTVSELLRPPRQQHTTATFFDCVVFIRSHLIHITLAQSGG